MIDNTFNQIKELIEIATSHDWFDILSLVITNLITIIAVGSSIFIFNRHAVQVSTERVIEKEVEKLYEASDCLFTFSDAANLYFSMSKYNIDRIIENKSMDNDFPDKLKQSSDDIYQKISSVKKSEFLLKSIGANGAADFIKTYNTDTIELRTQIYKTMNKFNTNNSIQDLETFLPFLKSEIERLNILRDECLVEIAKSKANLKQAKNI